MTQKKTARLNIRVDPDWLERAKEAADKLSLDLSAYVLLSVSERMRRDDQEEAKAKRKKT